MLKRFICLRTGIFSFHSKIARFYTILQSFSQQEFLFSFQDNRQEIPFFINSLYLLEFCEKSFFFFLILVPGFEDSDPNSLFSYHREPVCHNLILHDRVLPSTLALTSPDPPSFSCHIKSINISSAVLSFIHFLSL